MSSTPRHPLPSLHCLGAIVLAVFAQNTLAEEDHSKHPASPAMAEFSSQSHHYHGTGNFMFKYHFTRMTMKGLRDGSKKISTDQALADPYSYPMVPTTMDMNMHMFEGMYGMSDSLAFMAMMHYMSTSMKMASTTSPGLPLEYSTMSAKGLGDTTLTLMYRATDQLMTNFGVGIPTGAINVAGNMTMGGSTIRTRLPYDMQLGSGTFDLKPSVTYALRNGPWGFGAQGEYTLRTGLNEYGYKFGNRRDAQVWLSWAMNQNTEFSTRMEVATWGHIKGSDPVITPTPASTTTGTTAGTADPHADHNMGGTTTTGATTTTDHKGHVGPSNYPMNTGGLRLTGFVGMSGKSNSGNFGFSVEAGLPLYQRLEGVQMPTTAIVSSSISFSF